MNPLCNIFENINSEFRKLLTITITFVIFGAVGITSAFAQAGTSNPEPIDAGSYIIAMDNAKQGQGTGCSNTEAFNLRAYGLAVRLLHGNVPLKWAIANKANKDDADFTANATRITGSNCQNGGVNTSFAGGPLIVTSEYAAAALPIITTFNGEITGTSNDVRIYQVNAGFVAPIRYTLTHKPLVAIGPDGGGFGNGIHQVLFDNAKLRDAANAPYYQNVNNENIQPTSCFTIATQPHAADTAISYIDEYRAFAEAGGNLELQCYSVDVFENNAAFGRFQTTLGWTIFGTNPSSGSVDTPLVYPNPAMPFNQFVGDLANQDGRVTEFSLAGGSVLRPSTLIAARNSTPDHSNKNVATVSRIGNAIAGGNVFELGGHSYYRTNVTNTEIGRLNGQRMILNTLLIPAYRPNCGLSIPSVKAFKTVRMFIDENGNTLPNYGDTVEWTLNYINDSAASVPNFQVSDILDARLLYQGPLVVTATAGSTAAANPSYDGTAGNPNMLAAGATLAPGGRITIKLRTKVQGFGTILNQGTGTGTGIPAGGVKTDTADSTTPGTVAGYPIDGDCDNAPICLPQNAYQTGSTTDPTGIDLGTAPTAAPATVSGKVVDSAGRGIARASVTLLNAGTGETSYAVTNSFGNFAFAGMPVGEFYVLTVASKRHRFATDQYSFQLEDNISNITFVGSTGRFDEPGMISPMQGSSAPGKRPEPKE
ncbi:MAG: carboxypeptidase regulatory-like domain-containing protein [Pyrinomonadaceae bacterium]|nr:carboxypeptidase regulatory-like domain-containing protein [Blastocatellia bacterium]MCW5957354.1 carboxypeptidase regulatory-like domain-containing protein [Pyrinomonadaceae bacterium]